MRSRRQRRSDRDAEATFRYLQVLHYAMQARINAGDIDFDDVVYRTRDACGTLLTIRDSSWTPSVNDELIAKHSA